MPRYAPIPVNADDEDHELNRAFASDDERDAHDNTPLLAQHSTEETSSQAPARTPRTVIQHPTIDGRYNFEYDYPPPGSPPREMAGPNHWGNTNGIVVTGPVDYDPNNRGNWLSRTWRSLTGRGNRGTEAVGHSIGGGISNDGVFSNMASRPIAPRPAAPAASTENPPAERDSIFHAPEVAPDDVPPSYYAAQADTSPAYTVVATTLDEFMIDSLPAGSIFAFFWAFAVSVFLEWIGFALAFMLSVSHAGRCGAKAGLGVSFVRLGLWFRNRASNPDSQSTGGPEEPWWGALGALNTTTPIPLHPPHYPGTNVNGTNIYRHLFSSHNSTASGHHGPVKPFSPSPVMQWVAIFLMTVGWFIFMTSILQFWRVKRWERNIRASTQAQTTLHDPQMLSNLQIALGVGAVVHPNAEATHDTIVIHDAEIDQLEATQQYSAAHPEENEEELDEATRYENRLRRDLSSLGYL